MISFLGRRNCQRFLQKYFVLPVNNPLFEQWPESLKSAGSPYLQKLSADGQDVDCLPIIPLVGELSDTKREPQPPWPQISDAGLEKLKKRFAARVKIVVNILLSILIASGGKNSPTNWKQTSMQVFVLKLQAWFLVLWLPGWLTGKIIKKIKENLAAAGLP
jgi:hypothetical protein